MSDVLRAADALADAAEALRHGSSSNRRANLTVALDAYRAARDAAPADVPAGRDLTAQDVEDALSGPPETVFESAADYLNRIARGGEPSGLPVVLASVDDVATVCLAHGLTQTDMREWSDTGIQVRADSETWYVLLLGGGVGRGAELDYGYPATILVAAIEAARGAQT